MADDNKFLQQILIFEECSLDERKTLLDYFTLVSYRKDEIVFRQGELGQSLFIVKEGIVGSNTELSDGSKLELARYSRGKSFGEMSLIENNLYSTTSYAFTDIELFTININDFYQVIWKHQEISIQILKSMVRYMIADLKDADQFLMAMAVWGEKARLRAITDEMTGLYNKRFFEELLHLQITKSRHSKVRFSLMMFDIDNLHPINTMFGFEGGDKIIKAAADTLKSALSKDTIASRLGGDEFAVLMPNTPAAQAEHAAGRIMKILSEKPVLLQSAAKSGKMTISVSIGIAEYPDHGDEAESLKISADKALYAAKKAGRNKAVVFEPGNG